MTNSTKIILAVIAAQSSYDLSITLKQLGS